MGYKWGHKEDSKFSTDFILIKKLKKNEEWVLEEVVKWARRQNLANDMYVYH